MAIILPHGVLFRGGVEARIRKKLIDDDHIDTIIGKPVRRWPGKGRGARTQGMQDHIPIAFALLALFYTLTFKCLLILCRVHKT